MKLLLTCAAAVLFTTTLNAQNLKQREMIASDKIQVAEHAKDANQACGTNINFSVDYTTFSDVSTSPDNPNQQSPWAFFANVTDALRTVCGTPEGKAAVQGKIKTVVVTHAQKESEVLSGTTLHYAVPYNGAGVQTIVKYLRDTL